MARLVVNKTIVPERKGRGRRGYGRKRIMNELCYKIYGKARERTAKFILNFLDGVREN